MPPADFIQLRLYVAGDSPRSRHAIQSLKLLDETSLAGRFRLEVVDVLEHPDRAEADRVLATPMLLRVEPGAARRILGDLSDVEQLVRALSSGTLSHGADA
jgi:circadian clock protein KaiB